MLDLLFAMSMIGVPAVMLFAARLSCRGVSRSAAMAVVVLVAATGLPILHLVVADAYARLGESEGNGTLLTVWLVAILWMLAGLTSIFLISRARAAMQLGSESEK